MRALLINPLDMRYGVAYRFRMFAALLEGPGIEVKLVESNSRGENILNVIQKDTFWGYLGGTIRRVWLCMKEDYDLLVILKFLPLTFPCIIVGKLMGKKIVVDWDDLDSEFQSSLFRKYLTAFCEFLGPGIVDMVTTHSEYIAWLSKKRGCKNIRMIDQGIDTDLFDPAKASGRSQAIIDAVKGKRLIGYLCTLTEGGARDVDLILEAFSGLGSEDKDLVLYIIGGGPREGEVKEMIRQLGLQDKVIITGIVPHDEVPAHLAACELCLIYMREDRGNEARVSLKMIEYISMERPVVGHIVGETKRRFGGFIRETGPGMGNFRRVLNEIICGEKPVPPSRRGIEDRYSWKAVRLASRGYFIESVKDS